MWNRSYRWQRQTRLAVGVVVLVGLLVGSVVGLRTSPARRARAGARDLMGELRPMAERAVAVRVPAVLDAQPGTLVYLERTDGIAQVIGRVIAVRPAEGNQVELSIRLTASLGGAAALGGMLKGAPAALDLRDAVRLLVSPDTPDEEALRARNAIWPSVQANVLPGMIDGLIREISKELAALDPQENTVLAGSVARMHEALKPLEEKLVDQLARRAWDTVGIQGLATGALRSTADDVQNQGQAIVDHWWRLFGNRANTDTVDRPFLSEEASQALRTALEDETLVFWKEHRATIIDTLTQVVLERRQDFEAVFKERWAGLLYERAVVPAWRAGEDQVFEAARVYANDFAARRLLTRAGGPRLLFAHALRSALSISESPLLVFTPGTGKGAERIVYEPLLH